MFQRDSRSPPAQVCHVHIDRNSAVVLVGCHRFPDPPGWDPKIVDRARQPAVVLRGMAHRDGTRRSVGWSLLQRSWNKAVTLRHSDILNSGCGRTGSRNRAIARIEHEFGGSRETRCVRFCRNLSDAARCSNRSDRAVPDVPPIYPFSRCLMQQL